MEITGFFEGVLIVAEIADYVAKNVVKMMMLIKSIMILMRNVNLFEKYLYPQLHKLWQLVRSKWQQ